MFSKICFVYYTAWGKDAYYIYLLFFFTQEYEKVHSLAEMIETLVCSRNSPLKMAEREISALEPALVVFIFCFSI